MNHDEKRVAPRVSGFLLLALGGTQLWAQGALEPPGPPAPTMKTLTQVEPRTPIESLPYTISTPGSYYLTGNLTSAGVAGIAINADHVSLDLGGFSLIGPGGGTDDGIVVPAVFSGITIRNGVVREWGGDGVDAEMAHAMLVEAVHAVDNGGVGLKVGTGSVVRGCIAYLNTQHGITAETNTSVLESAAYKNDEQGIRVKRGCLVDQCTAGNNQSHGIYNLTGGATVSRSSAHGNTGAGIYIDTEAGTISNCTATTNGLGGLAGELGTLIVDSVGQSNIGPGILGQKIHVKNCTASENGNHGMVISDGSTVRDSVSRLNVGSGIVAGSGCMIADNQVAQNGQIGGDQAGILVTGSQTQVQGNTVWDNDDRGIDVDGTSNIIISNHAYGNMTDYDIAASNTSGPIITLSSGTLSTTDPYANFKD